MLIARDLNVNNDNNYHGIMVLYTYNTDRISSGVFVCGHFQLELYSVSLFTLYSDVYIIIKTKRFLIALKLHCLQ